jgi:hypothetical protein
VHGTLLQSRLFFIVRFILQRGLFNNTIKAKHYQSVTETVSGSRAAVKPVKETKRTNGIRQQLFKWLLLQQESKKNTYLIKISDPAYAGPLKSFHNGIKSLL